MLINVLNSKPSAVMLLVLGHPMNPQALQHIERHSHECLSPRTLCEPLRPPETPHLNSPPLKGSQGYQVLTWRILWLQGICIGTALGPKFYYMETWNLCANVVTYIYIYIHTLIVILYNRYYNCLFAYCTNKLTNIIHYQHFYYFLTVNETARTQSKAKFEPGCDPNSACRESRRTPGAAGSKVGRLAQGFRV